MRSELIVCRCEHVAAEAVEDAIQNLGCASVNEVKKMTRAGMGICQGRCCARLVQHALHRLLGPEAAMVPPQVRPPVRPVAMARLAALEEVLAPEGKLPAGSVNASVLWGRATGAVGTTNLDPEQEGEER
jgi:bacterioferritin-associated ferredoxin